LLGILAIITVLSLCILLSQWEGIGLLICGAALLSFYQLTPKPLQKSVEILQSNPFNEQIQWIEDEKNKMRQDIEHLDSVLARSSESEEKQTIVLARAKAQWELAKRQKNQEKILKQQSQVQAYLLEIKEKNQLDMLQFLLTGWSFLIGLVAILSTELVFEMVSISAVMGFILFIKKIYLSSIFLKIQKEQ
jgi:hypothetical protein